MPPTIHIFQHVPFEGLGAIEDWANLKNVEVTKTLFYEPDYSLPNFNFDLLIVLGGPMNVDDPLPFLTEEKAYIKKAIDIGIKVLGICLGAQLLAQALGGTVFPNPETEIGWFEIEAYNHKDEWFENWPQNLNTFHWHGDAYTLPPDAVPIYYSMGCLQQAFVWNNQAIGFQFHPEVSPESVRLMLENGVDDLKKTGPYIQNHDQIVEQIPSAKLSNQVLFNLLDRFIQNDLA